MMNRMLFSLALTVGLWPIAASAQGPYPPNLGAGPRPTFRPPTTSPYLNLLRGGNAAVNYYGVVLPEVNQRVLNYQFRSSIQTLDTRTAAPAPPTADTEELLPGLRPLPGTGHMATFGNYGGYYNLGPRGNQPQMITPSGPVRTPSSGTVPQPPRPSPKSK